MSCSIQKRLATYKMFSQFDRTCIWYIVQSLFDKLQKLKEILMNDSALSNQDASLQSSASFFWRWMPLAISCICMVVIMLSLMAGSQLNRSILPAIVMSMLFVHLLLIAGVMALAPVNFWLRTVVGLLLTSFYCMGLYYSSLNKTSNATEPFVLFGASLIQWLIYLFPMMTIRLMGWELVPFGQPSISSREGTRFGIRHLLIWTTIAGIILPILQHVVSIVTFPDFQNMPTTDLKMWISLALFLAFGNAVVALPVAWGCFVPTNAWLWLVFAGLLTIGLSFAEVLVFRRNTGIRMGVIFLLNGLQFSLLAVHLYFVRMTGWRLGRAKNVQPT